LGKGKKKKGAENTRPMGFTKIFMTEEGKTPIFLFYGEKKKETLSPEARGRKVGGNLPRRRGGPSLKKGKEKRGRERKEARFGMAYWVRGGAARLTKQKEEKGHRKAVLGKKKEKGREYEFGQSGKDPCPLRGKGGTIHS